METLRPPPRLERATGNALSTAVPMLGSMVGVGAVASMGAHTGPTAWISAAALGLSTLAWVLIQWDRSVRHVADARHLARTDYLAHLEAVRRRVLAAESARVELLQHTAPPIEALLVGLRPDPDTLRLGPGVLPPALRLQLGEPPPDADPVCVAAAERLVSQVRQVAGLPRVIELPEQRSDLRLTASEDEARAMLCRLAAGHPPDRLRLAILTDQPASWTWARWLPHLAGPHGPRIGVGPFDQVDIQVGTGADAQIRVVPTATGNDSVDPVVAEVIARRIAGQWTSPTNATEVADPLAVEVGRAVDGRVVRLDLREAAQGGVGPHGLVVGATGSGKSELLRTLLVGLIEHNTADQVQLLLIDFKGGAAFAPFRDIAHTAGVVTNLAGVGLVDRVRIAVEAEVTRRQKLLADHGGERFDQVGLPRLMVVIDEFTELLNQSPDFADTLASVGRLGRSLGIHLLLATQRLEEGRMRGLESHLGYRIALRTLTATDSHAVIGSARASQLPTTPGVGLLRTDTLTQFTARHVSAPPQPRVRRLSPDLAPIGPSADTPSPSVLTRALAAATGRPARTLWLPGLDTTVQLSPQPGTHPLSVTVGEVDRPDLQCRRPLQIDLRAGHVAIAGRPGSGRTTALTTIATAVAACSSPDQVRMLGIGLDLDLPHVRGAGRHPDLVARLWQEVLQVHRGRSSGRSDESPSPDWVVLVDSAALDIDALATMIGTASSRGIHLVIAVNRWMDLRRGTRELIATRIELRQGDALDSEVDRRLAAQVPVDQPGRGLGADRLHLRFAVPGPDLAAAVRSRWPAQARLRLPPDRVTLDDLDDLDDQQASAAEIRLGLGADGVVFLPRDLVVLGGPGSGRSTVLRTVATEIIRTDPTAQIVLVDPRGSLAGTVPPDQLLHHLTFDHLTGDHPAGSQSPPFDRVIADLSRYFSSRPRRDGPAVWLLVDDHELVDQPMRALAASVQRSKDLGLRVVVSRSAGSASRALLDPFVESVDHAGAATLLLPGDPKLPPLPGGLRFTDGPPGRARMVSRVTSAAVQIALAR
ncbi:MAG: FtsK/SpoIIIE domain-containing protein [Nocardioides sp.]